MKNSRTIFHDMWGTLVKRCHQGRADPPGSPAGRRRNRARSGRRKPPQRRPVPGRRCRTCRGSPRSWTVPGPPRVGTGERPAARSPVVDQVDRGHRGEVDRPLHDTELPDVQVLGPGPSNLVHHLVPALHGHDQWWVRADPVVTVDVVGEAKLNGVAAMRAIRIGMSAGTRVACCSSSILTGSRRPDGGAHSPWADLGV